MPAGRPSAYKPEYATQAEKLCELGATDAELADFFGVSIATLKNWKNKHPELIAALKVGKEAADNRVEASLYHKAIGYTFDAVKIFPPRAAGEQPVIVPYREHVPPDTTACIFWLKNRRKNAWRDLQQHEHGGVGEFEAMADDELSEALREEARLLMLAQERAAGSSH